MKKINLIIFIMLLFGLNTVNAEEINVFNEGNCIYEEEFYVCKNKNIKINSKNKASKIISGIKEDPSINERLIKKTINNIIYDISLVDLNGKNVKIEKDTKLYIEVPEGYDKYNLAIYELKNNKLIEYEVQIEDEYARIYVDHLGTFVFGEKLRIINKNIIVYVCSGVIILVGLYFFIKKFLKKESNL